MKLAGMVLLFAAQMFAQNKIENDSVSKLFQRKLVFSNSQQNEVSITYPNNTTVSKMMNYHEDRQKQSVSIDSSGFDIRDIDTSQYSNKSKFWQEVPVGLAINWAPVVGDVNNNGRAEIYGPEKYYSTTNPFVVIYELDSLNKFKRIHQYADSVNEPQALIDLDNDGRQELIMNGQPRGMIFQQDSISKLPVRYRTKFGRLESTKNRPHVGDFDKNGKTDIVYMCDLHVLIEEYDKPTNSFDSIYSYYPLRNGVGGFSIGDFDMDGKTDIVYATIQGDVGVIEAQGEHQYELVWTDKVETYNCYLHFWTNDIDGNGKPEFWVGGDAFYNGTGITRFTCFESDGNNSFVAVAKLDIIGIFSFYAGNCMVKDINKDGKQELFICLDQHVFVFNFSGSKNNPHYSLQFMKTNEMADQNSVYYSAALYDFTNDGKDELIVEMGQVVEGFGRRDFSRLYSLDIVTKVKPEWNAAPNETELFQNYPNPFNPTTKIKFHIAERFSTSVTIKIYNILGKEIRELYHKSLDQGDYEILWNGKNSSNETVESGVYFISLQTPNYHRTIKALYLK
jgi:hypothetical protein